jgi:hypothetical protein
MNDKLEKKLERLYGQREMIDLLKPYIPFWRNNLLSVMVISIEKQIDMIQDLLKEVKPLPTYTRNPIK